jgi:hypothetical protein
MNSHQQSPVLLTATVTSSMMNGDDNMNGDESHNGALPAEEEHPYDNPHDRTIPRTF